MNLLDQTRLCALAVGLMPQETPEGSRGVVCGDEYWYCPADRLEQAASLAIRFRLTSVWSEKTSNWEVRDPLFLAPPVVNENWAEAVVGCVARTLSS